MAGDMIIAAEHLQRVATVTLVVGCVGVFLGFDYISSGLAIAAGITVASAVRSRIANGVQGPPCCGCTIQCVTVCLIVFSVIGVLWSAIAVIVIGAQSGANKGTTYAWLVLTLILDVVKLSLASRILALHAPLASWLLEQAPQQAAQPNVIVIQMPGQQLQQQQQPVQFMPPPVFYSPQQQIHHHHHHVQYVSTNQYYGHPSLQQGSPGVSNPLHKQATLADMADPAPVAPELADPPAPPPPKAAPAGASQQRSRPQEGVQRVVVRKVVKSFEAQGPQLARLSPGVSAAPIMCNAEVDRAADLIARVTAAEAGAAAQAPQPPPPGPGQQ